MDKHRSWAPLAVEYGKYDPLQAGSIDGTDSIPHDRGIVRAMAARYRPNKQVKGNPKATLFVSKLSHDTTQETLKEVFSKYGKIENCRLIRDIITGRSKGYAFVEYRHVDDAEEGYHRCNKMHLDGAQIFVDFESERTLPGWVPRRLGGGFGGKKESGQLRFGGRDRPFKKPIVLGSRRLEGVAGEGRPWVYPTRRGGSRDSSEQSERPGIGRDKTHSRSRSPHRN